MSTNRKPPVKREPIGALTCRGCREPITQETTTWDVERSTFAHACGMADPANTIAAAEADAHRRESEDRP